MISYKEKIFIVLCLLYFLFSFYVYTIGTEEKHTLVKTQKAEQGKLLFQKHNCIACHQLYGLGGYLGPDLTTVVSRKGKDYAAAFIKSGTQRMPNYHLGMDEVDALVDYLAYVDSTAGTYKLPQ